MKKILVTGAAGFIGSHLSKRLLQESHQVISIENINDNYDPQLKEDKSKKINNENNTQLKEDRISQLNDENFTFVKMELEDLETINKIFEQYKPEIVINLAAQAGVRYSLENPHAYVNANVVGFTNILEACRHYKVEHLIYASSSSVYGANESKPISTNDNIDHPLSLYAATKKSNELFAHTYSHLYGLPTTGLRFFTVYGPWGRPDMALFLFTKAIVNDEPIN